ncbi:integrase catalytic domain-containing protein [Trichonephila clavipes]|nr:integrase catalytic domain-containing protein [Trichonephila clavipes]
MNEVAEENMKRPAVEENSSSPDNLLTVSGDGTWKTRGHSSLIGKIECEDHVQKRMGTRLRKFKLVYNKKKLSDGKSIGGKGRLTDTLIDKLAHYYGNAIRCNSTSVKEMRKAIWAVGGNSCRTNDEPMQWFCPTNPNTWCKYNTAINNNLQNYKHKPLVAKAVRDVIKPVFTDLSHPALLKKCLGGWENSRTNLKSILASHSGKLNPADWATRGLYKKQLLENSEWVAGPKLLHDFHPSSNSFIPFSEQPVSLVPIDKSESLSDSDVLSTGEFFFVSEDVFVSNKLLNLNKKATYAHTKEHHFTNLVIRRFHRVNFHAGQELVLSLIRQQFWIPHGLFVKQEHSVALHPSICTEFRGVWEASVKLTKQHLLKTLKAAVLNFEELDTILCQLEACINSRPLYPLSSDPKDLHVLTPGHFLIGCPLLKLPDHSLNNQSLSIHSRWSLLMKLKRMFWSRWQLSYLNTLQSRTKWMQGQKDLTVGFLVLIKNLASFSTRWTPGRIVAPHSGADGIIRVVTIQTSSGVMTRPVSQVAVLPLPTSTKSSLAPGGC